MPCRRCHDCRQLVTVDVTLSRPCHEAARTNLSRTLDLARGLGEFGVRTMNAGGVISNSGQTWGRGEICSICGKFRGMWRPRRLMNETKVRSTAAPWGLHERDGGRHLSPRLACWCVGGLISLSKLMLARCCEAGATKMAAMCEVECRAKAGTVVEPSSARSRP